MKKKQSPKKTSREHIPKAQRGSHETINVKRCLEPAVLAIRKVSNMDRPPTPYELGENRGGSELAPVFVPNKFMNGSQGYTQYARAMPSASWPVNRSPVISKVEIKPSNLSEVYRISKADVKLASSLPVVDRKPHMKLSNEELKSTKRASFLPKIDGNSKTNSGSLHNVMVSEASSEIIKLPPAKFRNSNITCKGNDSPQLSTIDKTAFKNASPEDVETAEIVPKPPSVSNTKDKNNVRRRPKRRKEEERGN